MVLNDPDRVHISCIMHDVRLRQVDDKLLARNQKYINIKPVMM